MQRRIIPTHIVNSKTLSNLLLPNQNDINQIYANTWAVIKKLLLIIIFQLVMFSISQAQTSNINGSTPLALAPGAPAGSYSLSEFENVNLFNGNLNFQLPLLQVGGRGNVGYTLKLPIERKWTVSLYPDSYNQDYYYPSDEWWYKVKRDYGPGELRVRLAGDGVQNCPMGGGRSQPYYRDTLTRMTFVTPNGTELELRDKRYGGQPIRFTTCQTAGQEISRGREFVTADGTFATFLSDTDITEIRDIVGNGTFEYVVSGYLMFKDGTRYRIDGGAVSWIRDRNGNRISFTYNGSPNTSNSRVVINDSLNRQTLIEYNVQDSFGKGDRISYKGFGQANRSIRIIHDSLNSNLRPNSGYSPQTKLQLFPQLNSASNTNINNPDVVSKVILPNGRYYKFYYNPYGELARVELPTGGAIEYEYAAGVVGESLYNYITSQYEESSSGVFRGTQIYRRVVERRVYSVESNLEYKTTYTRPEGLDTDGHYQNLGYVDEESSNSVGTVLTFIRHYYYGDPTSSLYQGSVDYPSWQVGREYQTDYFDANKVTVLQKESIEWEQRAPVSWYSTSQEGAPPNDTRVKSVTTSFPVTGQISKKTFNYDDYNNQSDVYEYDYGIGSPGPLLRRTHTDYLRHNPKQSSIDDYANNLDIHLRDLPLQQIIYDAGGNQTAFSIYEYDDYSSSGGRAPLTERPNISGHNGLYTSGYQTRGNLTSVSRWLDNSSGYITTFQQYDIAGNVVKAIDGQGIATSFDYSDRFGSPDAEARGNAGAAELGGQISYAFPTKVTNTLGHESYTQYDYYLGKPVNVEDANGIVSSTSYNDPLDRPTQGIRAVNDSLNKSQTAITYDDANRIITTTSDLLAYGDNKLKSEVFYDGLGRTYKSHSYENATNYITSLTQFDALGRPHKTSNPHRSGEEVKWTIISYDSLGRVIDVATPDGANVFTRYNGNQVTVTDQAGNTRKSETDALGRLIKVTEDIGRLNLETLYSYDALGNLLKVNQEEQIRTFKYDSLSRLTSATNPESGTINYLYDVNGNLVEKTDARGVKTTVSYDFLNRVTKKEYSGTTQEQMVVANATPTTNYYYDDYATLPSGAPTLSGGMPKGRLIGVSYRGGTEGTYYKYDSLGRIDTSQQRIGVTDYPTSYQYNLAGGIIKEQRKKRFNSMEYDDAGRLTFQRTAAYPYTVVNTMAMDISYTSFGAIQKETLGNNLIHSIFYNERQQPVRIILGTPDFPESRLRIDYLFGTAYNANGEDHEITRSHNNGNIARIKSYIDGVLQNSQTFQYDPLNRLRYAVEHNQDNYSDGGRSWFQTFDYDRFGNRGINIASTSDNADAANSSLQLADFSVLNNRITRSGFVYDVAGNLISEPGKSYIYDAENRIVKAIVEGGATIEYEYDGNGRRVKKKIVGGLITRFEYGAGGELLAEWKESGIGIKEYIYRGGELIATKEPFKEYQFATSDHLGSPRVWTDITGSVIANGRHDYMPFGEEVFAGVGTRTTTQGYGGGTQADGQRKQFTSKERDVETGLDYFGARFYSSSQGRFVSPDPYMPSADVSIPQSWNRYVYALNNPLRYIDPDGLDWSDLSEEQRRVFQAYADNYNKQNKSELSSEKVYGTLSESQMSTYESVTYALEHTQLVDKQGNNMGNALQQVNGVTQIAGEVTGASGDKQFRVFANMKEGAEDKFKNAVDFKYSSNRQLGIIQIYHKGFPDSYRQNRKDGVTGLEAGVQPSFSPKRERADIDVDYRFGASHLKPANSDVRAPRNYQKFIDRWPGLRNWWDKKEGK